MDAALIFTLLHLLHMYTLSVELYPILRSIYVLLSEADAG